MQFLPAGNGAIVFMALAAVGALILWLLLAFNEELQSHPGNLIKIIAF